MCPRAHSAWIHPDHGSVLKPSPRAMILCRLASPGSQVYPRAKGGGQHQPQITWTDCGSGGLPRGKPGLCGWGRRRHANLQTQPWSIYLNSSVFVIIPLLLSNGLPPVTLPSHLPPYLSSPSLPSCQHTFPGFMQDQSTWQLTITEFLQQPYEVLLGIRQLGLDPSPAHPSQGAALGRSLPSLEPQCPHLSSGGDDVIFPGWL